MRGYNDTSTRQQLPHIFVGTGGGAGRCEGSPPCAPDCSSVPALDTRQLWWQQTTIFWSLLQHYSRYHTHHLAWPGHWNSMELKLFNVTFKWFVSQRHFPSKVNIYIKLDIIYTLCPSASDTRQYSGWRWLKQNMWPAHIDRVTTPTPTIPRTRVTRTRETRDRGETDWVVGGGW